MAFPLYRPIRNSFSDRFTNMLSQDRTASSRAGRKRSNQAAELSDVSIEDDSKEYSKDDLMYHSASGRRDTSHKGGETDQEGQVKRITCPGRKRGSTKGTRGSNDDHSPKSHGHRVASAGKKETTMNDKSNVKQPIDSSRLISCPDISSTPTRAATLHSSEYESPIDAATIGVEASSSDQTIHPPNSVLNPTAMELDSYSPEESEESEGERISGMPDWAAELDEVVPGVKVISIKDVCHAR